MEIAKLKVDGVYAGVVMRRTVTAGLVGATISVEYAAGIWDELTKTVVFRGSVTKDVVTNDTTIEIPWEVLTKENERLQVGFYGVDDDKKQIIPTIWADLGIIQPGADPSGDTSTDPSLPVWGQIADRVDGIAQDVEELKQGGGSSTPDVPDADGEDGGYYTPAVTQLDEDTIQFEFTPSKTDMPAVEPVTVELPVGQGSGGYIDYDLNVRAVNHRGYSTEAPENTIPAYILSKKKGFKYVECDISFTSDGVPVLLHDSTIDRTSNGSGSIAEMTYAEVSKYDFGSWKSSAYTGTKIPTFEDFLSLCKRICLHPYIELKDTGAYTQEQISSLVHTVKAYGMQGKVTWISFNHIFLGYVKNVDLTARLGYLYSYNVTNTQIATVQGLQTDENEVYLSVKYTSLTDSGVGLCIAAGIPLEVWTVNSESAILALNPYITGIASDILIGGKVLYEAGMVYEESNQPEEPDSGDSDKTLSSISATYSGGEVAVGTALTALTGIVVTAHYSDGTTETVSDYTLSGEIAEGINTIIVAYEGKTTTFAVTGIVTSAPVALIDIDMADGTNIGTGGETYNAVNNGGTFANGKFIIDNDIGYLSVPTEFMAQSDKTPWTIAFAIDSYEVGTVQYARFARGNNDVPSMYYNSKYSAIQLKIANIALGSGTADYYDKDFFSVQNTGGLTFSLPNAEKTVIAFRNDGKYVSFWVNGVLKAYRAAGAYSSTYWASTFTIGDDASVENSEMAHMECSMLKLWDRALSDLEMAAIE